MSSTPSKNTSAAHPIQTLESTRPELRPTLATTIESQPNSVSSTQCGSQKEKSKGSSPMTPFRHKSIQCTNKLNQKTASQSRPTNSYTLGKIKRKLFQEHAKALRSFDHSARGYEANTSPNSKLKLGDNPTLHEACPEGPPSLTFPVPQELLEQCTRRNAAKPGPKQHSE